MIGGQQFEKQLQRLRTDGIVVREGIGADVLVMPRRS
jgi:hypothetical protein